jgi:L-fuconolactonase
MFVDAHQHFWVYDPAEYDWITDSMGAVRRNFLPKDLKPELDRNGFHGSIAVQACQTVEETRWLLELAEQSPWILGVVGWVDLRSNDVHSHLATLATHPKLVGIRHIVQSEPDDQFLLRPDFLRGVSMLHDFDLAYDLLIKPKHLAVAAELVERFPHQRFVLDHLAKPFIKDGEIETWATDIRRLASFPNVFCKLSGLVTEADWQHWNREQITPYLDIAFECFAPRRLMIGSDWPVCLVAGSYGAVVDMIKGYLEHHDPSTREAVLGNNAEAFYRLS